MKMKKLGIETVSLSANVDEEKDICKITDDLEAMVGRDGSISTLSKD